MKLLAEPRVIIEKSSKRFMRYGKLARLAYLERIWKAFMPTRSTQTGRKLRAAVLHGPCDLKLEYIPEEAVQQTQVLKKRNDLPHGFSVSHLNCIIK